MFIDDDVTEGIPERILQIFRALEQDTIIDIAEFIKESGKISRTSDYQLWRLSKLSMFRGNYEKALKYATGLSQAQLDKLYDEVIAEGYASDESLYSASGAEFIPYEENDTLQQYIDAVKSQTMETLTNFTNTTGFIDSFGRYSNTDQFFENILDKSHAEIANGVMSYDQVISKAVNDMVNSGIQVVNYDNEGKRPWHNRIDVAARRAIMTGLNQTTNKIAEMNADKLGTEWYEVSAHPTARPTHMIWQGKVYTHDQLVSVCGLGEVTGLQGANCYHHYDAFIPGISERRYDDAQLAKWRREADQKKEWNGKKYTIYEATQLMRQLETRMRAQREKQRVFKENGDTQLYQSAKTKQTLLYNQYKQVSELFNLPEQINRVYYKKNG